MPRVAGVTGIEEKYPVGSGDVTEFLQQLLHGKPFVEEHQVRVLCIKFLSFRSSGHGSHWM